MVEIVNSEILNTPEAIQVLFNQYLDNIVWPITILNNNEIVLAKELININIALLFKSNSMLYGNIKPTKKYFQQNLNNKIKNEIKSSLTSRFMIDLLQNIDDFRTSDINLMRDLMNKIIINTITVIHKQYPDNDMLNLEIISIVNLLPELLP